MGAIRHLIRTFAVERRSIDMAAHVLIVEDDPLISMDLEAIAAEAGVTAVCCASLREAFAAIEGQRYALALLDVDVTDGTTFTLARQLMERRVPVYFVSAVRQADIPPELSHAPLVPKPYRVAELQDAIRANA
jgi:DNA-binding response OmpR family regulator